MSARTMVETSAVLVVPLEIAVCPICGKSLSIQCDEWTQQRRVVGLA